MTTLISNADGNLTGSSTFAAAETGTGALTLIRNNQGTLSNNSTVTSTAFTVTNAKVIDAILIWCRNGQLSPTGTLKVDLQKGGVSQAQVTVNRTDLPIYNSNQTVMYPVLFKLSTTATGDGGSNWTIVLTTNAGSGSIIYSHTGTSTIFTKALRTTTAATAAAADDLYIVGELTGAGTHNSRAVTMNSTAATVYGNGTVNSTSVSGGLIAVAQWASLTYGTTASTNYILRIAGDLIVFEGGTLNIGASGAEIPRTSTAVLEFQPVSVDGDFGLKCYDYSTVNIAGLSRTSGKNIVQCKLTSDVTAVGNVISGSPTYTNASGVINTGLEATGNSLLALGVSDTVTNASHCFAWGPNASMASTTHTCTVWIARGSGTNNRYVRVMLGNSAIAASVTNGCYSDLDLQAGTAGTVTALGNGTATSVSITAVGTGYLVRLTGKASSGTTTPWFVIAACSAAGTVSFVGAVNQCFLLDHIAVVAASSISDTTFNVDTDTGWLSGDAICVASTTRTLSDGEIYPINANAGASSMVSGLYPFGSFLTASTINISTHHGTAPLVAEIGLLTRNVKIRSTSVLLMAYMYASALATVTVSWAEFYGCGSSASGKRGIEIDGGAATNPKSITYCALHDFDNNGLYVVGGVTSANVVFSNNIMFVTYSNPPITISGSITNTDWTFDSNLLMRVASSAFNLGDVGGTCSNNTVAGATTSGFVLGETGPATLGTFDNNTAHSCGSLGLNMSVAGLTGTASNFTAWRNASSGVSYGGNANSDLYFTDLTLFGNATGAGNFAVSTGDVVNIIRGTICADTTFPVTYGFNVAAANEVRFNLTDVDMSGAGGIYAPHTTADFALGSLGTAVTNHRGVANNCKFGAPALLHSLVKSVSVKGAYLAFQNYNQTAGDHRVEMTYGQLKTDASVYHTAAPSMKMTPNNASHKLESAIEAKGMLAAVGSGLDVTVSVWIRKDAGSGYTGNAPRLIARANSAIGITADAVLDTASSSATTNAILDTTTAALVTLSGGDLIVTTTGTTQQEQGARVGAAAGLSSGKFYFEATMTTRPVGSISNYGLGIGPTTSTFTLVGLGNTVAASAIVYVSGNIYANAASSGSTISPRSSGDVIGVAVDLDNLKVWFRVAPSGNWNGSGVANPATNTGGISFSAGTIVPFFCFGNTGGTVGSVITANFGATSFSGSVPSGFTSGWPSGPGAGVWEQLTGTTPTATDTGAVELIVDCDGTAGFINVDDWIAS